MNIQAHSFSEQESPKDLRLQAMAMQEIEGNPLSAEDIEMFEMFERENWPHERRRAYIVGQTLGSASG